MEGGKEVKQCMNYAVGERRNCLNTKLFRKKGKVMAEKFPPSQTSLFPTRIVSNPKTYPVLCMVNEMF